MGEGTGPRFLLVCIAMTSLIFGIGGFFSPKLFGTYLTPERCTFALVYSALSFIVARLARYWFLRLFCLSWAAAFGALSWVGYARGVPGVRSAGSETDDPALVLLFNGQIELGRNDHTMHLVLAVCFLITALLPKSWDGGPGSRDNNAPEAREPSTNSDDDAKTDDALI